MKNLLTQRYTLLLILGAALFAAGCRHEVKKEPPPPPKPRVHTIMRTYDHETALPQCALTVSPPAAARPRSNLFRAEKGKQYVSIDAAIRNTGDDPLIYSTFDFKLRDDKGAEYDPHFHQFLDPALNAGTLKQSQSVKGKIVFQIPDKIKITGVAYFTSEPGSKRVVFTGPPAEESKQK